MVKPTARSRSISATPEMVKRWDSGGDLKNDLIRTMMKCEGNKDCSASMHVAHCLHCYSQLR